MNSKHKDGKTDWHKEAWHVQEVAWRSVVGTQYAWEEARKMKPDHVMASIALSTPITMFVTLSPKSPTFASQLCAI